MRRAVDISSFLPALRCKMIVSLVRHYKQHPLHIPTAQTDASCYRTVTSSCPDLGKKPRNRGAWIGLQGGGQIDVILALDADALESELGRADRRGRIQAHLGADAVVRRRIELRAECP